LKPEQLARVRVFFASTPHALERWNPARPATSTPRPKNECIHECKGAVERKKRSNLPEPSACCRATFSILFLFCFASFSPFSGKTSECDDGAAACKLLQDNELAISCRINSTMTHLELGGQTPLHRAAARGSVAVLRVFLAACADPLACDNDGWIPLECAVQRGSVDCVRALLPCLLPLLKQQHLHSRANEQSHADVDVNAEGCGIRCGDVHFAVAHSITVDVNAPVGLAQRTPVRAAVAHGKPWFRTTAAICSSATSSPSHSKYCAR
jgi:hypothetical protein